jgi:hypothetical protein
MNGLRYKKRSFAAAILSAFLLTIANGVQAGEKAVTYRFSEFTWSSSQTHLGPTDPYADYKYSITYEGPYGPSKDTTGIFYKDIIGLMKYFRVASPSELVGKSFNAKGDPGHALAELEATGNAMPTDLSEADRRSLDRQYASSAKASFSLSSAEETLPLE